MSKEAIVTHPPLITRIPLSLAGMVDWSRGGSQL